MPILAKAAASAVLVLSVTMAGQGLAADLGGSFKDSFTASPTFAAAAGPCYLRGDVGYSISADPDVSWPVSDRVFTGDANTNGFVDANELTTTFLTDAVTNVSLDNTWLAEGGLGCGSGSKGFRGELTFGYRGDRNLSGEPGTYTGPSVGDPVPPGPLPPVDAPLHTSIQTYTVMFNTFYDFGNFNRFVPYVGAGIGLAVHDVDDVAFAGSADRIAGDRDVAFAWSLMAGVAYQITTNSILDLGYRYVDMGSARSGRIDSSGGVNPAVKIDDIAAHEVKLGLRYHFGQSGGGYAPFK